MKKWTFLFLSLFLIIILSGCSSKKTLFCSLNENSVKIIYNNENILEMYRNGEQVSSSELENFRTRFNDMGMKDFVNTAIQNTEVSGGSCSNK